MNVCPPLGKSLFWKTLNSTVIEFRVSRIKYNYEEKIYDLKDKIDNYLKDQCKIETRKAFYNSKKGKEFTQKMLKKLKDAGFKGGGSTMSKVPSDKRKTEIKKYEKRAKDASEFIKNKGRSFGSRMREKYMR